MRKTQLLILVTIFVMAPSICHAADPTPECNNPNVLVLFDVSGSMGKAQNNTKYDAATAALTAATEKNDTDINFGLLMFPAPGGMGCQMADNPQVAIGEKSSKAIYDILDPNGANFWGGPTAKHDTPMIQALDKAVENQALQNPAHRSYVILLTDGKQDCCPCHKGPDGYINNDTNDISDCLDKTACADKPNKSVELDPVEYENNKQQLVDRVSALAASGTQTFVVGFGSNVDATALNLMANAGQTAKADCNDQQTDPAANDNCFYNASAQDGGDALAQALADIAKIVQEESCDGIDNDCDGEIDEDWPQIGEACDGHDADKCKQGTTKCADDTKGITCDEPGPGFTETCDNVDNDCNGQTDEIEKICAENEVCKYGKCEEVPEDKGEPETKPEPEPEPETKPEDKPEPKPEPKPEDKPEQPEDKKISLPDNGSGISVDPPTDTPDAQAGCGCRQLGDRQAPPTGGFVLIILCFLMTAYLRRQRGTA